MKYTRRTIGCLLVGSLVLAATNPARTSEAYSYDNAGRLIEVRYGKDIVIRYTYDPNGNILERLVEEERIFSSGFEGEVLP